MLGLVTAAAAAPLDPDLAPLADACAERLGSDAVEVVEWDDASVDWAVFDLVVLRSTWDYTDRLTDFLDWSETVASTTSLLNSIDAIRWNTDKRYLGELAELGVQIIPTHFVAPGERPPSVEGVHVVKPTVGAGSSGASRAAPDEVDGLVRSLHDGGFTAMVQPYLDLLDEHGETALCFVGPGDPAELRLSHAFRKGAILTSTEVEQEGDLFAKEDISPREPSPGELSLARQVLSSAPVRSLAEVVYARVDVAPVRPASAAGATPGHALMELELVEPSFYFDTASGSVERFAGALAVRHDRAVSTTEEP